MQNLIVALLVCYAAFVVGRRFLPVAITRGLRDALAAGAQRLGWRHVAQHLVRSSAVASGCAGGCSGCGAAAGQPAAAASNDGCTATRQSGSESRIISIEHLKKDRP